MTNAKVRYAATIVRNAEGNIDIRIRRGDPTLPGDSELIEILYGDDEQELMARAMKFAQERAS